MLCEGITSAGKAQVLLFGTFWTLKKCILDFWLIESVDVKAYYEDIAGLIPYHNNKAKITILQ